MDFRFRRFWLTFTIVSNFMHRGHTHYEFEESRSLVISNGGIIKLIVGLTMPVDLPIGLIWLQNFQFQYPMIDSASQLAYLNLLRGSTTRNRVYGTLASVWDRFGMNGTACILRTICDVARYTLSHNGIFGQLLHTVFRPHPTSFEIYKAAKQFGETGGKCEVKYSHCANYFLSHFLA